MSTLLKSRRVGVLISLTVAFAVLLSSAGTALAAQMEMDAGVEGLCATSQEETQEESSEDPEQQEDILMPVAQEEAVPREERSQEPAQTGEDETVSPAEETKGENREETSGAGEDKQTENGEGSSEKEDNQPEKGQSEEAQTPEREDGTEQEAQTPEREDGTEQESETEENPEQEEPEDYFSPVVQMLEGEENAKSNYRNLRRALKRADGKHRLTVRIEKPGKYYVSHGRSIRIRSCTTLDLNGSTLIRYGEIENLLQVETLSGEQCVKGYSLAKDIVICNGTLDGSGNSQYTYNLINIGHTDGVEIRNVTFTHGQDAHLLELNGCRNCLITNCIFDGFDTIQDNNVPEAVQLDWSYNSARTTWNGVYSLEGTPGNDCTPCKNITICNCQFKDYPAGVGTHHSVYPGPKIQNVVIKNNTFTNTKNHGALAPAIWCYGFTDCTVSGNTITGRYSCAVRINGGSVSVKKNVIGTKKEPMGGCPIFVTSSHGFVKWKGEKKKSETCKNVHITGNQIYTSRNKRAQGAITVEDKSRIATISGNTIYAPKTFGIYVTGSAKVEKITNNKIVRPGKAGVHLGKCKTGSVCGNQVRSGKKNGIEAMGSAKVSKVHTNRITGCKGTGIVIKNSRIGVAVVRNYLRGNKKPLSVLAKGRIQRK